MSDLVLSLFPGIGLLDRAFELEGFTIVRGPDSLWGGDIHDFHVPTGVFAGVIGGPPCQVFSDIRHLGAGTQAVDLIPEFVRVVNEAQPQFVVMENVPNAIRSLHIPEAWHPVTLRDWDCGGETARRRTFWTSPVLVLAPPRRPGSPSRSVIASTSKQGPAESIRVQHRGFLAGNLPVSEYARLQGAPDIADRFVQLSASRHFIVHMLGNGVPIAMGRYVARAIRQSRLSVAA